jgi:YdjC-like protein
MKRQINNNGTRVAVEDSRREAEALGSAGISVAELDEKPRGALIVNADDWGQDRETTDRILDCVNSRTLSSVSAMAFMADSERAAEIARSRGVDAGLHLNLTVPFSSNGLPSALVHHQTRVTKFLRMRRLSRLLFHPGLTQSFEYVVSAQIEEFARIYGFPPERIDGHHHMHLCPNVVLAGLLPEGTISRRNFTFVSGEKSWGNRFFRKKLDERIHRRHRITDFLFALAPIEPQSRLAKIFVLAKNHTVELETHPVNAPEFNFLTRGGIQELLEGRQVARCFDLRKPTRVEETSLKI